MVAFKHDAFIKLLRETQQILKLARDATERRHRPSNGGSLGLDSNANVMLKDLMTGCNTYAHISPDDEEAPNLDRQPTGTDQGLTQEEVDSNPLIKFWKYACRIRDMCKEVFKRLEKDTKGATWMNNASLIEFFIDSPKKRHHYCTTIYGSPKLSLKTFRLPESWDPPSQAESTLPPLPDDSCEDSGSGDGDTHSDGSEKPPTWDVPTPAQLAQAYSQLLEEANFHTCFDFAGLYETCTSFVNSIAYVFERVTFDESHQGSKDRWRCVSLLTKWLNQNWDGGQKEVLVPLVLQFDKFIGDYGRKHLDATERITGYSRET
ncbi:hypothetical protein K458DRAFT_393587 [Lentithecium fluviatile CBS 122367]|uniref:Uncharacterized protein n=1 Tax=Lentithecium fluviatile CBS 122367 TaxID=1168545 RepID=A0A6G1INM2_9PLEO|nr:hypothetical protein K458DRAFT_393587 [Lentithecium fluviatile CBS 122367]